ncbi:MAG TPA: GMC family oxidoreductase [Anaeromyxobacter sp.]|nr:GMC family oxidoreductase [Anaeromyxobacter sp.]
MAVQDYDVVVIGSGIGGGSVARALAPTGARILVLERGERLPREPQNRDPVSVFVDLRYRSPETWYDLKGRPFRPGQYYYVGGATKMYGAAMFRLRERDFGAVEHEEGLSPAWPIRYADLEPYYAEAERIFMVHGQAGVDPTEPPRSGPFPHPPVPHEPVMQWVFDGLVRQGLHPFPMPMAVDLGLPGARCIRCNTCDAFPCQYGAKGDGETCLIDPLLEHRNVTLQTGSRVTRLLTDDTGRRIVAAEVERGGATERIHAPLFVLSAGAIQSANLLLRSATPKHPQGLANSSGQVGRNFMNHNCTAFMSLLPLRTNDTQLPKTLSLNDYYFGGEASRWPLGNLQMLGKILEPMLRDAIPAVPRPVRRALAAHSVDWYVMSEDLPSPENRVLPRPDGAIELRWTRTNMKAHRRFVGLARKFIKRVGFAAVLSQPFGQETPSHQCGTVRFGSDPATSALDPLCKAWDHDNLYVVDAGFFPSSAASNPALTVAAQGLRVGEHLRGQLGRS